MFIQKYVKYNLFQVALVRKLIIQYYDVYMKNGVINTLS